MRNNTHSYELEDRWIQFEDRCYPLIKYVIPYGITCLA